MQSNKVIIENVVTGKWKQTEYVCIYNGTNQKFNLADWKVIYYELPSEKILHTHKFCTLRNGDSFSGGERIRLISAHQKDHFHRDDMHWDIYTDRTTDILDTTKNYKIVLFDENDNILDTFCVSKYKNIQELKDSIKKPIVFIGHGQKTEWRMLKEHLQDKHEIPCVYFEAEERAGITIPEIIKELGKKPDIALLILTGEDKISEGSLRARQNVIHELGIFQSELGNHRAIPVVERGVEVPSNISGTQEIRFEQGKIQEVYGDILAVLRREFILF